jgi:subtilisin
VRKMMKRILVGVIDTGINARHPWLEGCVVGGSTVYGDHALPSVSSGYEDTFGHGTAVATILHSYCPDASLWAIRLARGRDLFPSGATEAMIAAAVKQCLDKGIGIINLSFSMPEYTAGGIMESACAQAASMNCIIVATYREDRMSYPAGFVHVLGVRHSGECAEGEVRVLSHDAAEVAALGGPRTIAHADEGVFIKAQGASYAAPVVAGLIARCRSLVPELSMREVLELFDRAKREHDDTSCSARGVSQESICG